MDEGQEACILAGGLGNSSNPVRLLALLGVLVLLAALPAIASAAPLFGVQADGVNATSTKQGIESQLSGAASARAKGLRLEVDWSQLEPRRQGEYDPAVLANLDAMVDGAARRGIKVLLFINRTPCWASSAPDKGNCAAGDANRYAVTRYQPADVQTAVPVSVFLVQRYGDKLGAYEVWNEPDQSNQKYWAGPDKVTHYVALMKALYEPIKQVAPALPVIAGSFVGTNGAWLKAMYAAGAKGSYDGLAVHFYDLPLLALKTTHDVQKANGDTAPLWLTEFGWTSCYAKHGPKVRDDHPCVTRAAQSRGVVDVFRAVARTSWVEAAIIYTLHDQNADYKFGLFDAHNRRKPSFTAVRSALGGRLGQLTRPSLRLSAARGRLAVSGTGSLADVYELRVYQGSTLRYRAFLRTTGTGSYRTVLPAVLGTSGLRVKISSSWSGASTTRRR
jgi:hypothetical protein